jgi:hypothetical protein
VYIELAKKPVRADVLESKKKLTSLYFTIARLHYFESHVLKERESVQALLCFIGYFTRTKRIHTGQHKCPTGTLTMRP